MRIIACGITIALVLALPASGQNLLVNPSFDCLDSADPCFTGIPCQGTDTPNAQFPGWNDSTGVVKRNDGFGRPDCPSGLDGFFLGFSGQEFSRYTHQTVTVPSEQADYVFSGVWSRTVVGGGTATYSAEVRTGGNPDGGTLLAGSVSVNKSCCDSENSFSPFAASVTKPAGVTELTVVLRVVAPSAFGVALHVNDTSLQTTTCSPVPQITSISPDFVVRDTNPFTLTVNGQGFISGNTNVSLVHPSSGGTTIAGTNVIVAGGGNSLTANFNMTDAPLGAWSVVVQVTANNCPPASAADALLVILPAFANGSFESPDPGNLGCSEGVGNAGVPTDWLAFEAGEWRFQNRLNRDGYYQHAIPGPEEGDPRLVDFMPSCPPPDGNHYGTIASDTVTGGARANAYQTIKVNPGQQYTFSGFFAGSGHNEVILRLRDGGREGIELGSQTLHDGAGNYDWRFGFVSAQAASDVLTVDWGIRRLGGGENATHADALSFDVCATPGQPQIGTITPQNATNNGVANVTLTGTGFSGTPVVLLSKGGQLLQATNVAVANANQLSCDFDLTGASSGRYDVIVKQGGCIAQLPGGFLVVASQFVNGGFEDPAVPGGPNHGDCTLGSQPPQSVAGLPTGWNTNAGLHRDGNAPLPPNSDGACVPSPDGGHYGSMSEGAGGALRSWQTVRVIPNSEYTFSGYFAGDSPTVLRLIDGDELGAQLAEASVPVTGGNAIWEFGSVSAIATSSAMTLIWEIQAPGDPAVGGHADGLAFEGAECNEVWADADGDGDVDHDDYGIWQLCYTGATPGLPSTDGYPCACFDRNSDGRVDDIDFNAFVACVSGPAVQSPGCP